MKNKKMKKYKETIDSIYNRNLWKVNRALENKEEIIIYISKKKIINF
jgi:hypothetical protein